MERFFAKAQKPRDHALFMVMLRCELRVEEVSRITLRALDLKQRKLFVEQGKGGKGRVVYLSDDALQSLVRYLKVRPPSRARKLFLVEKGPCRGKPLSVRGIQKRMEYYARKAGVKASCHQLRHTMATQLLNADVDLVSIQDLLGHSRITTTQRYCTVSNRKVLPDFQWVDSGWKDRMLVSCEPKSLFGAPAGGILAHRPCIPEARESQVCKALAKPTPEGLGLDGPGARGTGRGQACFSQFTHWKP